MIEDDIEDASVRAGAALRPFGCPRELETDRIIIVTNFTTLKNVARRSTRPGTPREIRASVVGPSAPRRRRRGRRSPPAVGAALSRDTRTYGNFNSDRICNFRNRTSRDYGPRSVYRYRVLYTQRLTRTKGEETIAPRHARILRRPPPKLASVESRHATPRTCTPLAQGPGPADLWGHADARETPTRRTRQQEHLHSRRPAAGESPPPPGRGVLLSVSLSLCLCLSLSLSPGRTRYHASLAVPRAAPRSKPNTLPIRNRALASASGDALPLAGLIACALCGRHVASRP